MSSRPRTARLALLVIALLALAACSRDVAFTLKYGDTLGLPAGSPIIHNTMKIGEVTSVELDPSGHAGRVAVRVDAKHRNELYREAAFTIIRRDLFGPATGARSIVMEDRGDVRTPIEDGDEIEGAEQTLDPALRGITKAIDAARGAVDESLKQREAAKNPEGQ
ncbi:MAG: MlaD family protein [Thermoanaerobaculia bacterium]|jgi:ABC-type transporter Mla subunit MlaD